MTNPFFEVGDVVKLRTLHKFAGVILERKIQNNFIVTYKVYWFDNEMESIYLHEQLERV